MNFNMRRLHVWQVCKRRCSIPLTYGHTYASCIMWIVDSGPGFCYKLKTRQYCISLVIDKIVAALLFTRFMVHTTQ